MMYKDFKKSLKNLPRRFTLTHRTVASTVENDLHIKYNTYDLKYDQISED